MLRIRGVGFGLGVLLCMGATLPVRAYGSEHVSAYQHDGTPYGVASGIAPRVRVAKTFYLTHEDAYDFLVVLPTFNVDLGQDVAGLHTPVRNDVQGVGLPVFNRAGEFGSAGQLKAYIDLRALSPDAQGTTVDAATALLVHEVAHQWTGHVRYRLAGESQLRSDLLGRDAAHWSFFFDSDASVLYGSDWGPDSPGTFSALKSQTRYSDLDLYLMGFLSPLEVGPLTLLAPEGTSPNQPTDLPPPAGTRIRATAQTLSVADIIRAENDRMPAMSRAQKGFRAAFVLLTPPGVPATTTQVQFVDALRKNFEQRFFFLTKGRGVFETDLVETPPGQVAETPGVQLGLNYLLAQQKPAGAWGQGPTSVRETHQVLDALRLFYSDPRAPDAVTRGGSHLAGLMLSDADSVARRALALRDASAQTAAQLAALRGHQGGAGLVPGYEPSTLDSILVGQAVRLAGAVPAGLDPLTPYLLGQQNEDGGWPMVKGGPSRFEVTSFVMEHLSTLSRTPEITTAAGKALAWLRAQRRPSGLYWEDRESIRATAWALFALSSWRQLGAEEARQSSMAVLSRQRTDGSWDGSPLDSALALRALRIALAPNLSLVDSDLQLSSATATEGETVLATVRFFNTGYVSATNVLVRAFDSMGRPMGEGQRVASVAAGERGQVVLRLDTSGSRGSSRVFVRVDASNELDESSEADNGASQPLFVSEPPEGVDLFVHAGSVTATPSKLARLPSAVKVTADVGNLGGTASSEVEVQVRLGSLVLARTRRAIGPRAHELLSWNVTVSTLPPDSAITVLVDALEEQVESREGNNSLSTPLERVQGVDVSVASLTVNATVDQGRDATIQYQVANFGTVLASVTPLIEIQGQGGNVIASLTGATLQVPAGSQVFAQAVWRASVSGAMRAVVRVTHPEDLDSSNDSSFSPFEVTASGLANLHAVGNALSITPSRPLETKSATAQATVRNSGVGATSSFSVDWYLGNPLEGGTRVFHESQPPLAAGTSRAVTATFTVPQDSPKALFLVLDAEDGVSEFDEDDNQVLLALQPIPIADLVVASADILPQPAFPQEGSTVAVSVSVLNAGGQVAESVTVQLLLGVPGLEDVALGEQVIASIPEGARREASFTWDTTGVKGNVRLVAHINRGGTTPEGRSDNNRAEKGVVVQDAKLALSEPFFSPNGDGVKDTTEVVYRLDASAPVSVRVLDDAGKEVRTLEAVSAQAGSLTWDGRSQRGRIVPDGTYRLMVTSPKAEGQAVVGTLVAVVDTNRYPIEKSEVASREMESLESYVEPLYYTKPFAAMPDESGVVFYARDPSTQKYGIYFQPLGGAEAKRLTREDWAGNYSGQLAISGDGRLAVFASSTQDTSGSGLRTLTTLRLSDGQIDHVVTDTRASDVEVLLSDEVKPVLSADGTVLFFASRKMDAAWEFSYRIESIQTNGTNRRVLAEHELAEMSLSPDGRSLAFVTKAGALYRIGVDGTGLKQLLPDSTISKGLYPDGRDSRIHGSVDLRHGWLPDGDAIVYVEAGPMRYVRTDCSEGCENIYESSSAAVKAVDVYSKAIRPIYEAPMGSRDFIADLAALHVNPLSGSVFFRSYLGNSEDAWIQWVTGLRQTKLFAEHKLEGGRFSPGGSFVHGYMFMGNGPALYRAISTRANLTARLSATRKPGASTIGFTGTAADANFESLEVGVRPYRAATPFVAISRGAAPVVRASLGNWTPPGPGLYEVQLLVRDKAGNVRTRRTTVGFSDRPVVANLTREPEYFSPNSDGVLDEVSIHYTVTASASIEFRVINATGEVVRRMARTHTAEGDHSLVWDGRDDNGNVAADGRYTLAVEGNELEVTLDTTPPLLALNLGNVNAEPKFVETIPTTTRLESVQVMTGDVSLKAQDATLVGWTLELARSDGMAGFDEWLSGKDEATGLKVALAEFEGRAVRLRARDLAGNEAVTTPQRFDEQLYITEVGTAFERERYWLLPGRVVYRMLGKNAVEMPTSVGLIPYAGPKKYALLLDDSVSRSWAGFSIAYRIPGDQEWRVDHSNVAFVGDSLVVWDTELIGAISEFEVRAQDSDGRMFTRRIRFGQEGSPVRLDACAMIRGKEEALLVASFDGPSYSDNSRLQPGALWTLESLDGTGELISLPVLGGLATGSTSRYFAETLSTATMKGCLYRTGFSAMRENGKPLLATGEVNLCVVQLTSQGGGVMANESFRRGGLRSLEIFVGGGGDRGPIARMGAFDSLSPTVPLDLTRFSSGQELVVTARGVLEDGTFVSTRLDGIPERLQNVDACHDEARVRIPPSGLTLSPPARNGMAPLCSVHQPRFTASITGAIATGHSFSTLAVDLNSPRGAGTYHPIISGFTPGSGSLEAQYSVDASALPEGVYWPLATATWSNGEKSAASSTPLIVDRTPAVALITHPAGGARVCRQDQREPNGAIRHYIDVAGQFSDAHLETIDLFARVAGGAWTQHATKTFNPLIATSVQGHLGRVDVTNLGADVELLVSARDASGSSWCATPVPVDLAGVVSVNSLVALPAIVSPDLDQVHDTTEISFTLTEPALVSVSAWKDRVKQGTIAESSFGEGPASLTWNGRLVDGSQLPDGDYRLVVHAVDGCGASAEQATMVRVDTLPPTARLDTPEQDAAVGAVMVVTGESSDVSFLRYELAVGQGAAPTEFTPVLVRTAPASGILGTVPTGTLPEGEHILRLTVEDQAGHVRQVSRRFVRQPAGRLIAASVTPALISPNAPTGDGIQDAATLEMVLAAPSSVRLQLVDGTGALVKQLQAATPTAQGSTTLVLGPAALAGVADGMYFVLVELLDTGDSVRLPLTLDTVLPVVALGQPLSGSSRRASVLVEGSVSDLHLEEWKVEHVRPGGATTLVGTGVTQLSGALAQLEGLEEGAHRVRVTARDGAGNTRTLEVPFTVDVTPPQVAFKSPLQGAFLSGLRGQVGVSGSAVDSGLATVQLRMIRGAQEKLLFTGASLPAEGAFLSWAVDQEGNGPVELVLSAEDAAGNRAESRIEVTLDSAVPVARVVSPRSAALGSDKSIQGTATDENLTEWTLALASSGSGQAWREVASSSRPVTTGLLTTLAPLPVDGAYRARLTVKDRAGNEASDEADFFVDTQPPEPPLSLVATQQRPHDVSLTWTPSLSVDVVAHEVLRASPGAEWVRLATVEAPSATYLDTAVADGTWRYVVRAVDGAGNISEVSPEAVVELDSTPPLAAIRTPTPDAIVRGQVEISGTAFSATDFKEYRLSIGEGASPSSWRVLVQSPVAVPGGRLADLDSGALRQGTLYTLRLEAEDFTGNTAEVRVGVRVDNEPPASPVLMTASAQGANVALQWQAVSASDLLGYVLFRDGAVANAPEGSSLEDLRPYALTATQYTNAQVPDGVHGYHLVAIDQAGNISPPSNTLSVTVETRAPSARIASPSPLARLRGATRLLAHSEDGDVASVQLQARSSPMAEFAPLGAPVTRAPFEATLASDVPPGRIVELRAVATDTQGNTDASPVTTHVLREAIPSRPVLSARVDAADVHLSWETDAVQAGVAGFDVRLPEGSVLPYQGKPAGTVSASSGTAFDQARAYDGSSSTYWSAGSEPEKHWQVVFAEPVMLETVSVWTQAQTTARVLGLVDGFWIEVAPPLTAPSWGGYATVNVTAPLEVTGLRLDFTNAPFGTITLYEVIPGLRRLTRGNTFTLWSNVGTHTYSLEAVGFGGTSSEASTATVRIYRPTLEAPTSPTADATVVMAGRNAAANSVVELMSDATVVATTTADASGAFTFATVPLQPETNLFEARATDAAGNRSMRSETVEVVRIPRPQATVALTLDGVAQSTVSLSFAISGDMAWLSGFALLRDSGQGYVEVATAETDARTFVDTQVRNGTHSYQVVPINLAHLRGSPSNAVQASVSVTPPPAPAMVSVSPLPEGGALEVQWQSGGGGVAYRVERALGATGPFEVVPTHAETSATRLEDVGLANGALYRYRVMTLDAQGNTSVPVEASGTPADVLAPGAPRFTFPTTAGTPVTLAQSSTRVEGVAEAGTVVTLFRNGVPSADTATGKLELEATPDVLSTAPQGDVDVSSNGRYLAYLGVVEGQSRIVVEEVGGGVVGSVENPFTDDLSQAVPSPDGEFVALNGYAPDLGLSVVYVARVATGTMWRVGASLQVSANLPVWSRDSRQLVVLVRGGAEYLKRVDVERQVEEDFPLPNCEYTKAHVLTSRGTGLVLCWTNSSRDEISEVDWSTQSLVRRFVAESIEQPLVVSPDASRVIAWARSELGLGLHGVPLSTAQATLLSDQYVDENSVAFSPDGHYLAAISQNGDVSIGTDGPLEVVGHVEPGSGWLGWSLQRGLVWARQDVVTRLKLLGRFQFDGVSLSPGATHFGAVSSDVSLNVSEPAAPIEVRLDGQGLPDLLAEVILVPDVISVGEQALARVTVRNVGGAAAPAHDVSVGVRSPDGALRALPLLRMGPLATQTSVTTEVPLPLEGLTGALVLEVGVDPQALVSDANRDNNQVRHPFVLATSSVPGVAIGLDAPTVEVEGQRLATVTVTNPGLPLTGEVRVELVGSDGGVARVVEPPEVLTSLPTGQSRTFTRTVAVGSLLAGSYEVRATLWVSGATQSVAQSSLTVLPEEAVALAMATSRTRYLSGEEAEVLADVTSTSRNSELEGTDLRVMLRTSTGTLVEQRHVPLPRLLPGAVEHPSVRFSTAALSPGAYHVTGEVVLGARSLVQAQTSFVIEGRPRISGVVSIVGQAVPQPLIRVGQVATTNVVLENQGTASAPESVVSLVVTRPDGSLFTAAAWPLGQLVPGTQWSRQLALATTDWSLGLHGLTLVIESSAGTAEVLSRLPLMILDGRAPRLSLVTPTNGMFVRGVVNAHVRALDDASGVRAVRVAVDGAEPVEAAPVSGNALEGVWSKSVTLVSEGPHTLVFSAVDLAGNDGRVLASLDNPLTVTVIRDTVAPVLTVSGVPGESPVHGPVVPVFSAQDDHLATVVATLDGEPFTSGTPISTDGVYELHVVATDKAGNTKQVQRRFTIDTLPPRIVLGGVAEGAIVNHDVTPTMSVSDLHLEPTPPVVTLNGQTFTLGTLVSNEGSYELRASARDVAGHLTEASLSFAVDKTPPEIQVTGVSQGAAAASFTIHFTATDAHLDANTLGATLDGLPFTSGGTVNTEGPHSIQVSVLDRAGNSRVVTLSFSVVTETSDPLMPTFRYAACGLQDLLVYGDAQVVGPGLTTPASVAANSLAYVGERSLVSGDLVGGYSAVVEEGTLVGSLYYGEGYAIGEYASVQGAVHLVTPTPTPCWCGYDVMANLLQASSNNDNVRLSSLPGSSTWWVGGSFELNGAHVVLPSGRYYADHLRLTGGATLSVEPGARVLIFVNNNVLVEGGSTLGAPPAATHPLTIVSGASKYAGQSVRVDNAADASLAVYSPEADLLLSGSTTLYGALMGKTVELSGTQRLVLKPGPQASPPSLHCQ
ncbi:CARDB domain-containing protein [Myxococcus landrumensis]|uniref:Ig-like domain repeat protein n=1 Tax=Myxococcus landrumensis TaxID=2813577 RepID=A0ABX7NDD3_9BACT|nr:CARDB domain-containing protein [Myxococcus landrumus]QSQ15625.1 Ig-like domain repeat protein [Myxococcus landrumus]